jgi:hypothetical protein
MKYATNFSCISDDHIYLHKSFDVGFGTNGSIAMYEYIPANKLWHRAKCDQSPIRFITLPFYFLLGSRYLPVKSKVKREIPVSSFNVPEGQTRILSRWKEPASSACKLSTQYFLSYWPKYQRPIGFHCDHHRLKVLIMSWIMTRTLRLVYSLQNRSLLDADCWFHSTKDFVNWVTPRNFFSEFSAHSSKMSVVQIDVSPSQERIVNSSSSSTTFLKWYNSGLHYASLTLNIPKLIIPTACNVYYSLRNSLFERYMEGLKLWKHYSGGIIRDKL